MDEKQQKKPAAKPVEVLDDDQEPLDVSWMNQARTEGSMAVMERGDIIQMARRAKAQAEAYSELRRHSLEITMGGDWLIQGQVGVEDPEVYLEASGARRLAHAWGVRWYDVKQERVVEHDSDGEYYLVMTTGMVSFLTREVVEIGIASSRDRFFATEKDGSGGLMASEDVNIGNVYKKSMTDFVRRAVTNTLGLEALPLSELPERHRKAVKRVEYGKGTKGGKTQTAEERSAANNIWNACVKMAGGDQKVASELLWSLSKWKGRDGKELGSRSAADLQRLAGKSLEITYSKVKDAFRAWEKNPVPYVMSDLQAEEALAGKEEKPGDGSPFGE